MKQPTEHTLPFTLLFAAMLVVLYQLAPTAGTSNAWPPSAASQAAHTQIQHLALNPGDTFRGRSITLLQMDAEGPNNWDVYFYPILDLKYRVALRNDLTNDAKALGVPVANEFGHWISPPALALLAAAFYNPRDLIGRATQAPRVYRANLARLMGVGLVVSDKPIPGETRLYEGKALDHPVYVHKVADTNMGQYSPTRTVLATSASAILDQLQAPGFDGSKLAIVEAPTTMELVPAERVAVRLNRGPVIHVSAYSRGTSLLILPFDYSHCLRASGAGLQSMLPVNLSQTGLIVRGEVSIDISYRYSLFGGKSCRKRDLRRVQALGLEKAATGRLFHARQ